MDCVLVGRFLSVNLCAPAIQFRNLNFSVPLYKRNHYEVLGVNKNATIKEIKEAYYTKSKQYHPDNSDGNARQFLELKQAYDILRRPADRRNYDNFLAGIYTSRPRSRPNYYHGQNWNTYWQHEFYRPFRESERAKREAEVRSWRNIFRFTFLGVSLISAYNFTVWYRISRRDRIAETLSAQDEIAKCFLRQAEFRGLINDNVQVDYFARLLRGDIEQAQRLKDEERRLLGIHNPLEIREEERWMAAVRTPHVSDKRQPST